MDRRRESEIDCGEEQKEAMIMVVVVVVVRGSQKTWVEWARTWQQG